MNTTDWLGFTGVFLILLAYFLNVSGRMQTGSLPYILLNVIGAGLACLASVLLNYVPFIILEGAWTLVSLVSLVRYSRRHV